MKDRQGALIVSSSESVFSTMRRMLRGTDFAFVRYAPTMTKAKQQLARDSFGLVIIYTPLPDEFGLESAAELSERWYGGIVLMVAQDIYEQARRKVRGTGVCLLSKRVSGAEFLQAVDIVMSQVSRMQRITQEYDRVKRKLAELNDVSRAKCLLIERERMTEEEAHEFLVHEAMNTGKTRKAVAEHILRKYGRPSQTGGVNK